MSVHILTFDLLRQFWNVPKFFCKKYKWTNKVDLFNTGCEKLNQCQHKTKIMAIFIDKHIFTFSEKPTKVPQPPRHFYNRSPVLESKKRPTPLLTSVNYFLSILLPASHFPLSPGTNAPSTPEPWYLEAPWFVYQPSWLGEPPSHTQPQSIPKCEFCKYNSMNKWLHHLQEAHLFFYIIYFVCLPNKLWKENNGIFHHRYYHRYYNSVIKVL